MESARDAAARMLGIEAAPTFFVNGKKLPGDLLMEALAREIGPYLTE